MSDLSLAELQRWLVEMPPIFSASPDTVEGGTVRVRAVMNDLFETLTGVRRPAPLGSTESSVAQAQWCLAACHLLWHPALRASRYSEAQLQRVFFQEVALMAAIVPIAQLVQDEERREELIRRTLRALNLTLPGESTEDTEDRLGQVDSVEQHRVIADALAREQRTREVREQMASKAAQEAAAKVSRE